MIKEAICTGISIDDAKEAAIAELAAPESVDVNIEVMEFPQKKTLGLFGGSPAKVRAYYEIPDVIEADAADYLKKILSGLGIENPEITTRESDGELFIDVNCEDDYGIVIGRRGETLYAIQYLTRLVAGRGSKNYQRVNVNIGNYREKRETALKALATKNANQVLKYGRPANFEPMNPYERRIIHTTVQEIDGVTSHSVGTDSERRVVITLEEGVKPTHAGGYNRGGRRDNKPRNGYRNDQSRGNKPAQTKQSTPATPREPRRDAASFPLYGEVKKD